MAEIKVADISRWQGQIDWDTFAGQVSGVVIKVGGSDGGLYTDSLFNRNRNEARRLGVPRWFYWYKGAAGSPEQQAQYFLNAIGGLKPGEGLVLDDENESVVNIDFDVRFADEVKRLTKLNIILYSNQARFQGNLQPIKDRNIGAWSAKYGSNSGSPEGSPATAGILTVIMWQYTSTARIAGVSANTVDMNLFYGTVEQFQKYGAPGAVPAPTKPPTPAPTPAPAPHSNVYIVNSRDYDGLAAAMARLGISNWKAVADLNGLKSPYVIHVGDRLKLTRSAPQPAQSNTYTVKNTDADGLIAALARIGVNNWKAVADMNGIHGPNYTIYPGQVLRLPGGTPSTNASRAYYIVKKSDSDGLAAAMRRIGITNWQRVAKLNGLSGKYVIHAGDKLWLN